MPRGSAGFIPAKTSTMTSQSASGDGRCAVMTYCAPISLSPCKTAWSQPGSSATLRCWYRPAPKVLTCLVDRTRLAKARPWLLPHLRLSILSGWKPHTLFRSAAYIRSITCSRTANPRQQTSQGVRCVLDWRYQTLEVGTEGPVVVEDKTQILHQGSHFDLHSPHS